MIRLRNAATIAHAWEEDSKYYDVTNLTGIPAHIVNYVNHEKLSEKIDSKFHQYEKLVKDELDKRQMGGGSSFELLESQISKPILDQLSALKLPSITELRAWGFVLQVMLLTCLNSNGTIIQNQFLVSRQKRKRDRAKELKKVVGTGEDDDVRPAQRPRRNTAGGICVSGSVASTTKNLSVNVDEE